MIINDYVLSHRQPNLKYSSTILIILDEPNYMRKFRDGDFLKYQEQYKKLNSSTFEDFIEKSQQKVILDRNLLPGFEIITIKKEQSKNRDALVELYPPPDWNGSFLEFSQIGFNDENDQAFVYFGFEGLGVGSGVYFVLEKKGKKWKYKKVIPAWAA